MRRAGSKLHRSLRTSTPLTSQGPVAPCHCARVEQRYVDTRSFNSFAVTNGGRFEVRSRLRGSHLLDGTGLRKGKGKEVAWYDRRLSTAVGKPNESQGPVARYDELVQTGVLRNDEYQRSVAHLLQRLYDELLVYEPPPISDLEPSRGGFLGKLLGKPSAPSVPAIPPHVPKGIYLHGDVGCGKSMLMDLFYDTVPSNIISKRRIHFHAFMIEVHRMVHEMKEKFGNRADVVVPVAREMARNARVLCFDEFQVTDIVDAMILKRLMESLMGYGVVAVMTSNRQPDALYKNGIQRESFVPCIDLINSRFVVEDLDSGTDYRKIPKALSRVYYHPSTDRSQTQEVEKIFNSLTSDQPVLPNRKLKVWGRELKVPISTGTVARFTFKELCDGPMSAADYLEITKKFETIFVVDIPKMSFSERDKARRFILFIDSAYESKTKLFTLSEVPITQIFSDKNEEVTDHQKKVLESAGVDTGKVGASSLFTDREEVFAFARCVSRLIEMGTRQWAERSKGVAEMKGHDNPLLAG